MGESHWWASNSRGLNCTMYTTRPITYQVLCQVAREISRGTPQGWSIKRRKKNENRETSRRMRWTVERQRAATQRWLNTKVLEPERSYEGLLISSYSAPSTLKYRKHFRVDDEREEERKQELGDTGVGSVLLHKSSSSRLGCSPELKTISRDASLTALNFIAMPPMI